ncbi:hypothetical protein [Thermoactinomyces mirandus]|uniref:Uncharacterized protein n=1 Tax=Thermoactinomyces mirandus TaxID=2756294 RepID=A0A7W1XQE9_9BACL|nr:hypothetical protein [Thermoactinomyces mirandus]MBA4601368.1 hypothetical protein [Thermoactinomyces mirandus]
MKNNQEDSLRYWKELQNWSSLLSRRTKQIEEVVKALQSINMAVLDKGRLKELISALASMDQLKANQQKEKTSSSQKNTKSSVTKTESNDELVQLMNTPVMSEIIKEVFKNKRKW